MSLAKFSFREVRARPSRAILTFISITIGVGAVVAVLLATATSRQAQRQMLSAVSGKADLEIIADIASGFSYSLVKQVREVDGVELAVPSLHRFAVLFAGEQKARAQVLGIDPRIDQQVRGYEIVAGKQLENLSQILVDQSFAQSLQIELTDTVKILARGGLQEYTVVGLVEASGGGTVALGSSVYMVLPAAQSAFGTGAKIDQIQLLANESTEVAELNQRLREQLDAGVTVREPRTSSKMAEETLFATENGLHMAIAFAILISAFIIYNTFQMSVGERRKQLGILRAVGATRGQIRWMILREALWLSSLASVAGCFLGVWGSRYLNQATEKLLQVDLPNVSLTWLPFIVAVGLGISVSLLGALLPARRASRVEPVEAMRAIEAAHNAEVLRYTRPLAVVTIGLATVGISLAVAGKLPLGGDVVSVVLLLLGCILLIPTILTMVSRHLAEWLRRWFGIEAFLAQKQLFRNIGRSTLTIGVLFIAISTTSGMAGNVLDNVQNVRDWYTQSIIGDFFVRATMPDFATGASADIPPGIGEELEQIDGIESIDPLRFVNAQSGDDSVLLVARDFVGSKADFFDLTEGSVDQALQGMERGQTVIGSVLAQRSGLQIGDQLPLETEEGTVQLEIAAITNDYLGGGLTVYLQREFAERLLDIRGVDAYIIKAQSGKLQAVEQDLQRLTNEHGLILQSYAELISYIDSMINGVIASLWMLLALGCVIAAMGLVNTLTMNILEQTREIGVLRVVAMTRGQVRRMIFAQASLLGVIGLIPGTIAGIFVSYIISLSAVAVLGHDIVFHFRPTLAFGCLALGLIVVLLASLIPAERASRLELSSALHYE